MMEVRKLSMDAALNAFLDWLVVPQSRSNRGQQVMMRMVITEKLRIESTDFMLEWAPSINWSTLVSAWIMESKDASPTVKLTALSCSRVLWAESMFCLMNRITSDWLMTLENKSAFALMVEQKLHETPRGSCKLLSAEASCVMSFCILSMKF